MSAIVAPTLLHTCVVKKNIATSRDGLTPHASCGNLWLNTKRHKEHPFNHEGRFLTCDSFVPEPSSISCEMSTPLWRGYDGRCQGSDLRVCLCLVARVDNQLEV